MSSDYHEFRDAGFWSKTLWAELWSAALIDAVDELAQLPSWLVPAREHWELNATIGWHPVVFDFDRYCEDASRRACVADLMARADAMLSTRATIPKAELAARQIGGHEVVWGRDIETLPIRQFGRACSALIEGRVRPRPAQGREWLDTWYGHFASNSLDPPAALLRDPPADWDLPRPRHGT